ncbi:MAG: sodium:proton antiporter [Candidatus Spechtbacterales bacterium]|nr:sodium:proton antiporter [Candidatus Spechtbacterales bacterium]
MEHFLIGLSLILILGVLAQWIAWRLKLPSILLLLIFGFLAGAATGVLKPVELFGESLLPAVSLAVAIILFEGGLNLHWKEFREIRKAVRNLILMGAAIAWALTTAAAYYILNFDLALSVLLGAILIVTGPTVIMPILRHIRPSGSVGSILKWEGILIDPVGALLAVFVFDIIFVGHFGGLSEIIKTLGISTITGVAGAAFIVLILKRYWVPDFLHNPVALMTVIGVFTASDLIQSESGLLAVIIMGLALANQKFVSVEHIVEFKENLQILLIGGLFVVLAAQLTMADLASLNVGSYIFLAALIIIVRPAAVYLSTIGSNIGKKVKLFLAGMAPRGIVAAAIASIFATRLQELNYPGAERLVPITFLTIIGTVAIYGLGALPFAKRLGIADADPQGILMVGADESMRKIGAFLNNEGYKVVFADSSWDSITAARLEGLEAAYTNILSEHALDEMDFGGIGYMLALTKNDQVNTMACMRFAGIIGRANVYQLWPDEKDKRAPQEIAPNLRGRLMFSQKTTYNDLNKMLSREDTTIKMIAITQEFTYKHFISQYAEGALPLFIIDENEKINIISKDKAPKPVAGQKIIAIVRPPKKGLIQKMQE